MQSVLYDSAAKTEDDGWKVQAVCSTTCRTSPYDSEKPTRTKPQTAHWVWNFIFNYTQVEQDKSITHQEASVYLLQPYTLNTCTVKNPTTLFQPSDAFFLPVTHPHPMFLLPITYYPSPITHHPVPTPIKHKQTSLPRLLLLISQSASFSSNKRQPRKQNTLKVL